MTELKEQLNTCRNLISIAQMLIDNGVTLDKGSPLTTALELLYQESQSIIDDYCVVQ